MKSVLGNYLIHDDLPPYFADISLKWLSSPFLSSYFQRFNFIKEEDPNKCSTIGVNIKDGKISLYYNPKFLEGIQTIYPDNYSSYYQGILLHELLHIVNLTFTRQQDRHHRLWNQATDYPINDEVLKTTLNGTKLHIPDKVLDEKGNTIPFKACIPKTLRSEYKYEGLMLAEPIYIHLKEKQDENTVNMTMSEFLEAIEKGEVVVEKGGATTKEKGSNGKGKKIVVSIGDHGSLPDNDEDLDEKSKNVLKSILNDATARGWGDLPSNLREYIEQISHSKINWRRLLRNRVRTSVMSESKHYSSYTWKKRNRRGLPTPGKRFFGNEIILVLDTSGSTLSPDIQEAFFTEIEKIVRSESKVWIVQFDTEVKNGLERYKKGDYKNFKIQGGGGTYVQPVFDFLKEKNKVMNPIIVLTDGYFEKDFHTYGNKNVTWVITQDGDPTGFSGTTIQIQE